MRYGAATLDDLTRNNRNIRLTARRLRRGVMILRLSNLVIEIFGSGRGRHRLNDDVVRDLNVDGVAQRVHAGNFPQHAIPRREIERLGAIGRSANPDPCLLPLPPYYSTAPLLSLPKPF